MNNTESRDSNNGQFLTKIKLTFILFLWRFMNNTESGDRNNSQFLTKIKLTFVLFLWRFYE
jgi:hypothetical protein